MSQKPIKFSEINFKRMTGVSRETLEKLSIYVDLLSKWQLSMNLVGSSTLEEVWSRHILDSAQIFPYIDRQNGLVLDLGAGAGFPGLVLSIMGVSGLVLIESSTKK